VPKKCASASVNFSTKITVITKEKEAKRKRMWKYGKLYRVYHIPTSQATTTFLISDFILLI
jgi:hypothetical protein